MLKRLTINNYILIDNLIIDFNRGLSAITGETGAGKSILVGALNLLGGGRADLKTLKPEKNKLIIEAEFDITTHNLQHKFDEADIDYSPETIIRREITAAGKSRNFINDTPVSTAQLKDISSELIDIHSQHQNLLLSDNLFQLTAVDIVSKNSDTLELYRSKQHAYTTQKQQLKELIKVYEESRKEEEYLQFIKDKIEDANIQSGEQEELESELKELTHAEDIKRALYTSSTLIDDDGLLTNLKRVLGELQSIDGKTNISDLIERTDSIYIELQDISSEISTKLSNVNFDERRITEVEERLSTIYDLLKRYDKKDDNELQEYCNEIAQKLSTLNNTEDAIKAQQKVVDHLKEERDLAADELRKTRVAGGELFAKELEKLATPLAMPNLKFEVQWDEHEPDINGTERAVYYFTANKNRPLQPLSQSASGGEISRLMLCVKSMIAQVKSMPTILFDEIDTGISGETASKIGDIMASIAQNRQVITITHLPQVAAYATTHYKVNKTDNDTTTNVSIDTLTTHEREEEIARMISGSTLTDTALNHARELLKGGIK